MAIYSTYDMRVRAVQAVKNGMPIETVAKANQVDRSTVHRWLQRHKKSGGKRGLLRRPVSGRPRKLKELNQRQLRGIIMKPASHFGYETNFWTCPRLVQVLRSKMKMKVSRHTVWRRLRDADLTYKKPERRYFEASKKERKEWLKQTLPKILDTVREHRAILYFEDEANIALTAVLAKTWFPRGKVPKQEVTGKRGGIAALSAISKRGDLIFQLLDKRINSDDIIGFLSELLKHHPRRHLVVVMDQAPPHTSKKTTAFIESQRRLHVFFLPKYSPDWNPDEKVWNHLKNQELKGHGARTKTEIKKLAKRKLTQMSQNESKLRGIFFRCCIAELLH